MEKIEVKGDRKFWMINIEADEMFGRISRDSNYREHSMESGGAKYILLEDDRGMFDSILKSAFGNLWLKIGRMSKEITNAIKYSDVSVSITLEVNGNYDDNMLFSLGSFIEDYIEAYVLREWYICNHISNDVVECERTMEIALNNVVSIVHYRKKAVKRPINPIL